jgi:glucose-1-phosphate cytidylyltransferase
LLFAIRTEMCSWYTSGMKAVILAGGLGTRISEETQVRPKPMVEVGGRPILWHILKTYSTHGINEFVICLGYKGYMIKEYFANYYLHMADVTFDMATNAMEVHQNSAEPWRVTLLDTGENTQTGGRLKRVRDYVSGEDFCFTYGDGVGDVDIKALVAFHHRQGTKATVTAVQPPGRYGALDIKGNRIAAFEEKPPGDSAWISGGYFVLSPSAIDYIENDDTIWERGPMERLAQEGQMSAYTHRGFWHPMDTIRDKLALEAMWESGQAPWKVWE